MSVADEALIRASMEHDNNKSFKCRYKEDELLEKYSNDPHASKKIEHILKAHRINNSCDVFTPTVLHKVKKFGYKRCLCYYNHPLIYYYFIISENFDNGILPDQGALNDQSARLIDIIYLLKSIKAEHQKLEYDEMMKKNKKTSKR